MTTIITSYKGEFLTTTINTFSQEFFHTFQSNVFDRDAMTCVTLLLLDYIARHKAKKIKQNTIGSDSTREREEESHFYELIYMKKDADLDSRQVDTCSITSVRSNSTNLPSFFLLRLIKFISMQEIKTSKNVVYVYLDVFRSNDDIDHKSRCSSSLILFFSRIPLIR